MRLPGIEKIAGSRQCRWSFTQISSGKLENVIAFEGQNLSQRAAILCGFERSLSAG